MRKPNAPGKVQLLPLAMILAAVLLGAWAVIPRRSASPVPTADEPLNVLLITLDTTRADRLGCYGYAQIATPNMDRLAREGTLFKQCACTVPITLPSHASIMTGTYPFIHGVRNNGIYRLHDGNVTLAERLSDAGYTTGALIAALSLDGKYNLSQGFRTYDTVPSPSETPLLAPPEPEAPGVRRWGGAAKRPADIMADLAIAWLRAHASRKFFLWTHFFDPHWPYEPPERFLAQYNDPYDGEIAFMDEQIGRVLAELAALDLDDRTLVVLVGDHGEALGDHGEESHTDFVYDSTMRVPLIFRCPGRVPAGRQVSAWVRTVDVAPTILAFLGLEPMPDVHGVSLWPLVSGEVDDLHLAAYGETVAPLQKLGYSPLRCLWADGWKYILAPKPELYHVAEDPGETRNLVIEEPDKAAEMKNSLKELIEESTIPTWVADSGKVLTPEEEQALAALGYAIDRGSAELGLRELAHFEPRGPDPKDKIDVHRTWTTATRSFRAGRLNDAETAYRKLRDMEPDSALIRLRLGVVLAKLGKLDEAIQEFRDAIRMDSELEQARKHLALLLRETGNLEESIKHYREYLARTPYHSSAHYDLGVTLTLAGRLEEAIGHFRRADELAPGSPEVNYNLGTTLAATGRLDEAIKYLERAVSLQPVHAEAHFNLANALLAKGQPEQAAAHYLQALRIKPDLTSASINLGMVLNKLGDTDGAVECLSRAMRTDPDRRELYAHLSKVLIDAHRPGEAIKVLETGLARWPEDLSMAINLAWLLATSAEPELRDGDRAVALAEKVVQASGIVTAEALNILAAAYAEAGRFDDAVTTARRAIETAQARGQEALVRRTEQLLELYQAGRPYHESN